LRAAGVQRAALAGVLSSVNLSIRERWICVVGVAGVSGVIAGRGRGSEVEGLGWVGVGCCVVGGGGSCGAVRGVGSGASVIVLVLEVSGSWLGGAVDVLKLVGGGEGRSE